MTTLISLLYDGSENTNEPKKQIIHTSFLSSKPCFFSSPKKYTKPKMVSLSPFSSCFLTYISLLSIATLSFTTSVSTKIPLNTFTTQNPPQNPYQKLNLLASSSLHRAHILKNPNPTKTPIFSNSYGGYTVPLSFGTPPQTLPFILDTGSHLVWFPCTSNYTCHNCSFSTSAKNPTPFIPKMSSTAKLVGCRNPKCTWLHPTNLQCQKCNFAKNCSQICPPYLIMYGSGFTGGIALSEKLTLRGLTVTDFFVGCSVFSIHTPTGIVGLGRGPASLPSQLGVKRFSYCLISRKFDDTSARSFLVLDTSFNEGDKTASFYYTPFVPNPNVETRPAFSVYYYVSLRRITVGSQRVRIPFKFLAPGVDGNGGTIVDSGTTFTYLAREVHASLREALVLEMERGGHARDTAMEEVTGLTPCFKVNKKSTNKTASFPTMTFHFKGGADMALPVENYLAVLGENSAVCLTLVTDRFDGAVGVGGPGIVLGGFQMQNYKVEFDLVNGRFGFKKELCESE